MQFLASSAPTVRSDSRFRQLTERLRLTQHLSMLPLLLVPILVTVAPKSVALPALQAQTPQSAAPPTAQPAATPAVPVGSAVTPAVAPSGEVTEEELRHDLVGKQLFLRGEYLGDSISFNEHGDAVGTPAKGSFTLSGVEIEKVKLTRHKVELEGDRYALHYVGGSPYDDPNKGADRVKITPRKKILKITIDREQVTKTKTPRSKGSKSKGKGAATPAVQATPSEEAADSGTPESASAQAADPKSVTTTTSSAHSGALLRQAIDRVFAEGVDQKLRAQLPEFWQLYFEAQAAGVEYRPKDASVLRAGAVDQQAKLLSSIAPASNPYAQANQIAGRALYSAVIGTDGKPAEIAVLRPIGFGLDENAVAAIRKASFQPAMKGGHPVAEALDLAVIFRIYANQTGKSEAGAAEQAPPAAPAPVKPGPYSVNPPPPPQ